MKIGNFVSIHGFLWLTLIVFLAETPANAEKLWEFKLVIPNKSGVKVNDLHLVSWDNPRDFVPKTPGAAVKVTGEQIDFTFPDLAPDGKFAFTFKGGSTSMGFSDGWWTFNGSRINSGDKPDYRSVYSTPEPAAFGLVGLGLLGIRLVAKRRLRRRAGMSAPARNAGSL